jgi:hypothetical protein
MRMRGRIWIIHKFYTYYPMFKIGYPIICLPRIKKLAELGI